MERGQAAVRLNVEAAAVVAVLVGAGVVRDEDLDAGKVGVPGAVVKSSQSVLNYKTK